MSKALSADFSFFRSRMNFRCEAEQVRPEENLKRKPLCRQENCLRKGFSYLLEDGSANGMNNKAQAEVISFGLCFKMRRVLQERLKMSVP